MMTISGRLRPLAPVALVLGPVLYAAGTAIFFADGPILALGLDRAKVQGLIGGPLLFLAPGVLALAWTPPDRASVARLVSTTMAITIAVGRTASVAATVTQVGCQPVTPPFGALPQATVLGLAAGLAFALSVAAGARLAAAGRPGAALAVGVAAAGATYALQIAAMVALFPGVSCGPRA